MAYNGPDFKAVIGRHINCWRHGDTKQRAAYRRVTALLQNATLPDMETVPGIMTQRRIVCDDKTLCEWLNARA